MNSDEWVHYTVHKALKERLERSDRQCEQLAQALEDITQAAQQEGLQFSGWQEQVDKAVAALSQSVQQEKPQ
tara:strand:+ start:754 stop:969 length:216 start_codon:yes stop_codon:yes gene_type:complete